jgi:hypothetical protein
VAFFLFRFFTSGSGFGLSEGGTLTVGRLRHALAATKARSATTSRTLTHEATPT